MRSKTADSNLARALALTVCALAFFAGCTGTQKPAESAPPDSHHQ